MTPFLWFHLFGIQTAWGRLTICWKGHMASFATMKILVDCYYPLLRADWVYGRQVNLLPIVWYRSEQLLSITFDHQFSFLTLALIKPPCWPLVSCLKTSQRVRERFNQYCLILPVATTADRDKPLIEESLIRLFREWALYQLNQVWFSLYSVIDMENISSELTKTKQAETTSSSNEASIQRIWRCKSKHDSY